jgi:NADPH2:quinone reductase
MKAIVMTAPGGPEVLALQDLPIPALTRDTDVLVRVHAAGINPVDTKMRAKPVGYPVPLPPVLGCDGAGVIEAVGRAVSGFRVGDAVYYSGAPHHDRLGSYAELALVDHRLLAPKPASLSFVQAAAAPLVLITAWEALHDRVGIRAGNKVLIHAGAGGVGHVAIQLARLAGCEVATTVSTPAKAGFVRALGATKIIAYREQNFVDAMLDWTDGAGVDVAFDTVGGRTLADSFAAVRIYGDVVTLLAAAPEIDWGLVRLRNQRLSFELMLTPAFLDIGVAMAHQGKILRQAAALLDGGKLRIEVGATLPLAQAAEAHRLLAAGQTPGKIVLTLD